MRSLLPATMTLGLFLVLMTPKATLAFDEKTRNDAAATTLRAGVARVEITDHAAGRYFPGDDRVSTVAKMV